MGNFKKLGSDAPAHSKIRSQTVNEMKIAERIANTIKNGPTLSSSEVGRSILIPNLKGDSDWFCSTDFFPYFRWSVVSCWRNLSRGIRFNISKISGSRKPACKNSEYTVVIQVFLLSLILAIRAAIRSDLDVASIFSPAMLTLSMLRLYPKSRKSAIIGTWNL